MNPLEQTESANRRSTASGLLACPTCGVQPETRNWHTYCPKCGKEAAFGETPWECEQIWNAMVARQDEPATPNGGTQQPDGSVKPLTEYETAQINAAIVLMRRGEVNLAAEVINVSGKNEALAEKLKIYVMQHSPNESGSPTAKTSDE